MASAPRIIDADGHVLEHTGELAKFLRPLAFLEAGASWVPYMMDRMDEEHGRRGRAGAQRLTRPPSDHVQNGNLYFSCEVEEKTLPLVLSFVGEDRILFASDYPHERKREQFGGDIPSLLARDDVTAAQKEKILYRNALRLYGSA